MPCKRCEQLNTIPQNNIQTYISLPTFHHEHVLNKLLKEENIAYTFNTNHYIIDVPDFKAFVFFLDNTFNTLEKKDILLLPYDPAQGITPYNIHALKSLLEWKHYYAAQPLKELIEYERVSMAFQPIVDKGSREVIGNEILLRGFHDDGSVYPPAEMFHDAKRYDLIFNLDEFARKTAIKTANNAKVKTMLFINFIPTSIYDPKRCLQSTNKVIRETHFKPKDIVFEVVETEKIEDFDHLNYILNFYRQQGYKTALDDVGSGYATDEALINLRPDIIKIDRSIIQDIDTNSNKQQRLDHFIALAKDNNIKILAEGVETETEANYLDAMDIDYFQGHYFGKPDYIPYPYQ